ncbi:hypothetical protein L873DRAFT_1806033 [Choiromyces venosus 120613-1]|uniref:Uncharacterized protein n=1 Tax=Choiromyces venosus 120613-1 TaxID=1336337 RepID=A0A3N4K1X7_9PEZI|nr:hypothetical protein L873DRAFT_1806033 [Choiromyces venosus 120613-1]
MVTRVRRGLRRLEGLNRTISIPLGTHAVGAAALFGASLGDPAVVKRSRRFIMDFVLCGDPNGGDGGAGNGVIFP